VKPLHQQVRIVDFGGTPCALYAVELYDGEVWEASHSAPLPRARAEQRARWLSDVLEHARKEGHADVSERRTKTIGALRELFECDEGDLVECARLRLEHARDSALEEAAQNVIDERHDETRQYYAESIRGLKGVRDA
jgi:hypothetical protein